MALAHGAHLVGQDRGVDGDGLLEHGQHRLLYLGARVVEVHEQPAQQVLEVGAVEVGAVGVVARVAHRVQKVDERRAHLEADGVARVVEPLEELGVERARVGLGQPRRAELAEHVAERGAAEAARLDVLVVEAREQHGQPALEQAVQLRGRHQAARQQARHAQHRGEAHLLGDAPGAPHEVGEEHGCEYVLRPLGERRRAAEGLVREQVVHGAERGEA
mmetsp:Transcript_3417/g.8566  ORF Transcript_3417/g.8566 Transcript_3417/m.8566 type:complete len:218 (+) Transcript_3417:282-935(+)